MLKSITLKNFQCHRRLHIDLDPHVTVIVGANDKGKSAIIRALRLATLNKPHGAKSYIRRGTKQGWVQVRVDGRTIRRTFGSNNLYTIDDEIYKSFRSDVPPPIRNLLRTDYTNFQLQHEPIFWFSQSPGQTAKSLNSLIDLHAIDRAQREVRRMAREKRAEREVVERRITQLHHSVARLRWTHRALVKLGKLLAAVRRYRAKSHRLSRAGRLAVGWVEHDSEARRAQRAIVASHTASVAGGHAGRLAGRAIRLAGLVGRLVAAGGLIQRGQWAGRMVGRMGERERVDGERRRLEGLIRQFTKEEERSCQKAKRVEAEKRMLEERMGGRCPSCGGMLTNAMILY